MDKLTDILSSFFVSSPKPKKRSKQKLEIKQTDTQEQILKQTQGVQTSIPSISVDIKQTLTGDIKEPSNVETSDNPIVSEIFSEIQHVLDKMQSKTNSDNKRLTTEETFEKQTSSFETKSKTTESESRTESQTESEKQSEKRNQKKSYKESETDDKNKSILSSLSNENDLEENEKDQRLGLKKYILRPSDFYKSNLLIVNDDIKDSIEIVSDLLYKLGLMKDVNNIYDNNIHVITSSENKKEFTKMLLDNPYLYFTNFNVKQQLSKKRLRELDRLERRTIYIIDNKTLSKPLKQKDIRTLMAKNVHVIIIAGEEYNLNNIYNAMGTKRVLIHKLNKSKNMQKHFYKTVIKKICGSREHTDTFEEYSLLINNENVDIKYIILKGNEIRYN